MNVPAKQLTRNPTLNELLEGYADAPALPVEGIASDSRELGRDSLFLACAGGTNHGLDFCNEAVRAGVVAIAYDSTSAKQMPADTPVPLIPVANLDRHLGDIANRYFGNPSQDLKVIGVTGTNGKSTVAWMIAQCLQHLNHSCAYAGTLGYGVKNLASDEYMTSPGVIETHRRLAGFRDAGAAYAAIEVSSHALVQNRVDGVRFDTTLFTNLSRDHLDYHGDMHAYGEAKAKLFCEHAAMHRIVNLDSEFGAQLASRCREDLITVSTNFDRIANGRSYVFARAVVANNRGSDISVQSSWGHARFSLPLPGEFNVANAVLVLAFLLVDGVSLNDACNALSSVAAPPGRMQRVPAQTGPAVYIDYAHTPEALEMALHALRAHCRGKVWCVFGCGGDRDMGKRPLMGRIAERRADRIVITSDNPRGEAPKAIIADITAGLNRPLGATVLEDRGAAIAWAIRNAAATDIVLIAGKGHENYQLVGVERLEFSDFGVALGNLDRLAAEGRG